MARIALSVHDTATARSEAAVYTRGAAATRNGNRVRQAHELNGLVSLEAAQFDLSLVDSVYADLLSADVSITARTSRKPSILSCARGG